ncbi:MAG TPA: hypothetical protein VL500_06215 [Candidatus Eisenbacteria bacterium]|nr:hypothetical protein [Candidatus Eisenbacteria bacterium]
MTNTKRFWMVLATATTLALAGCGLEETGGDATHGDATDVPPATQEDTQPADGGASADSGTGGSDGGTTETGTASDGGSTTGDAGTAPAADGGAPAPDAGSPSPDAGAPASDAGSPSPDAGTPAPGPAPLRSPASCQLRFADAYIGGATCGQVRGNLPGATWSSGPAMSDTNADHELELALTAAPAGTYDLTYVSATCPGGPAVSETWASYGSRAQLLAMTADARSFVSCNWWDAATGTVLTVSSPGCNLRIAIDGSCNVTGAGNMRNYH